MTVYKYPIIRVLLPFISLIFIFFKSLDICGSEYKYKDVLDFLELLGLPGLLVVPLLGGLINFLIIGFMRYVVREPYTRAKSVWLVVAGVFSSILGIFSCLLLLSVAGV